MRGVKRVMSCAVVFAAFAAVAVAGQAAREGGRGGARMSPEERAKLAKTATSMAAEAVAQHLKLSEEAAEKFTKAYVAESQAAQERVAKARESGDREQMMSLFRENREKMQKVLQANLKPEQAKKAGAILGGFGSLERSIMGLLRAKVEKGKMKKALPVLVKYAESQGELFAKMRGGGASREELMGKFTALREKTVKELTPIIGEEAAATWERTSGMRGMGGRGQRGGGQRGGGQRGGNQ